MIDKKRFSDMWTIGTKHFGYLKRPWTISENNVRASATEVDRADIKANLAPNIKAIGLQQLPVVNGKGEVFIGGRRTVACEINGEETLLVEIRDIPDVDQMSASWGENYTKRDMRADQEGRLFQRMIDKFGLSQRDLAKKLGNVSQSTVARKIAVYKDFYVMRNASVPHNSVNDSPKTFNFGKAIELLPLNDTHKDQMMSEIADKGMTQPQVRELVKQSITMEGIAKSFPEDQKDKILEAIEPMLFKKDMKPEQVIFKINEVAQASHKTVPHQIPKELYPTQEEADTEYFKPRFGRCLGDKTEQFWYGTINKQKHRQIELAKKEAKKNDHTS